MPTPITDKREMYKRLNAGLLGHTLPATETVADTKELLTRGGLFAVRSKVASGACVFNLTPAQVWETVGKMREGTWNVSPMLNDANRICYAHLWADDPAGWFLHYSEDPKPCRLLEVRDGCRQKHLTGLAARLYLQHRMDDIGWLTLLDLIESYPDHCIEFTVMNSSQDAYGPSNTIYWEVRTVDGIYERPAWGEYSAKS